MSKVLLIVFVEITKLITENDVKYGYDWDY